MAYDNEPYKLEPSSTQTIFEGNQKANENFAEINNDITILDSVGTAATADKQTSPTDTTAGALMAVGAFGLGIPFHKYRKHVFNISTPLSPSRYHHIVWDQPNNAMRFSGTIDIYADGSADRRDTCRIQMTAREDGSYSTFEVKSIETANGALFKVDVSRQSGLGWTVTVKNAHPSSNIDNITIVYNADCVLHDQIIENTVDPVTFSGQVTQDSRVTFRRNNILGTVSQSGGVPTGAIIERGSSDVSGNQRFYTLYADGTLEQWAIRTVTVDASLLRFRPSFTFLKNFADANYYASIILPLGSTISFNNITRDNIESWGNHPPLMQVSNAEFAIFTKSEVSASAEISDVALYCKGRAW